jgi:hypothetical protein
VPPQIAYRRLNPLLRGVQRITSFGNAAQLKDRDIPRLHIGLRDRGEVYGKTMSLQSLHLIRPLYRVGTKQSAESNSRTGSLGPQSSPLIGYCPSLVHAADAKSTVSNTIEDSFFMIFPFHDFNGK